MPKITRSRPPAPDESLEGCGAEGPQMALVHYVDRGHQARKAKVYPAGEWQRVAGTNTNLNTEVGGKLTADLSSIS